jgi:hypothetical protein
MKLPQLSLRELLLLVVVAALGCGWWLKARESNQWQWRAQTLRAHIEESTRRVTWTNRSLSVTSGDFTQVYSDPAAPPLRMRSEAVHEEQPQDNP